MNEIPVICLPVITDEIADLLRGSGLIIADRTIHREWSQEAVDFVSVLQIRHIEDPTKEKMSYGRIPNCT